MTPFFNPLDPACKSVTGGAKCGETITFTAYAAAENVRLRVRTDYGETRVFCAKKATSDRFTVDYTASEVGLFFYSFEVDGTMFGMDADFYGREKIGELTAGGREFELTVYDESFVTPESFKGGIIYQIFPDRFCRSASARLRHGREKKWGEQPDFGAVEGMWNGDFFLGDLKGITSRLDYLRSLSVTAIYLNPVFEAASNHRYDTGDYMKVDANLGTENDLKKLFSEAKKREISVILDGVFSHTGDDSRYFNRYGHYDTIGAYMSENSPYRSWYNFDENGYRAWWGVATLPETREDSPGFSELILGEGGVIDKYTKLGAGGWRLDVADELPSSFIKGVRARLKSVCPDAVLIGEVWENVTDKISYGKRREYFRGKELDSAMNYPLKDAIIQYLCTSNAYSLAAVIRRQCDVYPAPALNCMMNILGTHDTFRIINALSGAPVPYDQSGNLSREEYSLGVERLKLASVLQYAIYGVPSIYYGDERGMTGWGDPYNRRCMDWNDEGELLAFFIRLGKIRESCAALREGSLEICYLSRGGIVFSRKGDEYLYIAVNLGYNTLELEFDGETEELLSEKISKKHTVPHFAAGIYKEIK